MLMEMTMPGPGLEDRHVTAKLPADFADRLHRVVAVIDDAAGADAAAGVIVVLDNPW
jgi:hypothetical protein